MSRLSTSDLRHDRAIERLCLALAFFGALLCVAAVYGNMWIREASNLEMPVFQKSKPAVADWPRQSPKPRV